jgi:hypothetical protein
VQLFDGRGDRDAERTTRLTRPLVGFSDERFFDP